MSDQRLKLRGGVFKEAGEAQDAWLRARAAADEFRELRNALARAVKFYSLEHGWPVARIITRPGNRVGGKPCACRVRETSQNF